jgi:hypothetical protein
MSTSTKVLIGFGIGCAVLLVLCCGLIGVSGVWLANFMQNSLSEDPAKVVDATKEIADIEIPESLKPKAVFDVRVPFSGERAMLWVSYEGAGDNHLVLGQFGPPLAHLEDFESQLKQSMNESGRRQREDIDIEESETYDAKINGEDAKFTISQGKGRKSEKEFWEALGQFHGHGGPAMLIIRVEASEFTKEQVIDVIKSMED